MKHNISFLFFIPFLFVTLCYVPLQATNFNQPHQNQSQPLPRVLISPEQFDATVCGVSFKAINKCTTRKDQTEECLPFIGMPIPETRDGILSAIGLLENIRTARMADEIIQKRLELVFSNPALKALVSHELQKQLDNKTFIPNAPEQLKKITIPEEEFDSIKNRFRYGAEQRCTTRPNDTLECVTFLLAEIPQNSPGILSAMSFLENSRNGHLIDELMQKRLLELLQTQQFADAVNKATKAH